MPRTLHADDVVFMYAARDEAAYADYGTTVVGWGGAHTLERVRRYEALGIHATGTMWCLTADAEALHADADLREAVCRDIAGQPIRVPRSLSLGRFINVPSPTLRPTATTPNR